MKFLQKLINVVIAVPRSRCSSIQSEFNISRLAILVLLVCSSFVANSSAFAKDRLKPNETLYRGQKLTSSNGSYRLEMQTDGNLVVYNRSNKVIWHTHTHKTDASRLVMQGDGNLVLYSSSNKAHWHTHTDKRPNQGIHAIMQNDGNFVLYTGSSKAIWNSMGHTKPKPPTSGGDSNVADYTATVTASTLNVRSGPSTGYSIIGKKYRNQTVRVTHHNGVWRRIAWSGGRKAYVHGNYVTSQNTTPSVNTPTTGTIFISKAASSQGIKLISSNNKTITNVQIRGFFGKCLEVERESRANGTAVQIAECKNNANKQRWNILSNGLIQARHFGNKCLDLAGPSDKDGARVQIWDCNSRRVNQKWYFDVEDRKKSSRLRSKFNNKCVDVTNRSSRDGTNVQMWRCNYSQNKQFSIGRAKLRGDFSLTTQVKGGNQKTNIICWSITTDSHFCRQPQIRKELAQKFIVSDDSSIIEKHNHALYGKLIVTKDWIYEGCQSPKNSSTLSCDYKYPAKSLLLLTYWDKLKNDGEFIGERFNLWAPYIVDTGKCSIKLGFAWIGKDPFSGAFAVNECAKDPLQIEKSLIRI